MFSNEFKDEIKYSASLFRQREVVLAMSALVVFLVIAAIVGML